MAKKINIADILLAAFDIDGTLLTDEGLLLESTVTALQRLKEAGVLIATISARSRTNTLETFPALKDLCCANGFANGAWATERNGAAIVDSFIEPSIMPKLLQDLDALGCSFCLISYDSCQAVIREPACRVTFGMLHKDFQERSSIDPGPEIKCHMLLVYGPRGSLSGVIKKYQEIESSPVLPSRRTKLEFCFIQKQGVNKGLALSKIAQRFAAPLSKVMALGDGLWNDLPMFKVAERPVAMLNAFDELKKHAVAVTERDNNYNGAGHFVMRLLK